jgi:hypothetical protein
MHPNVFLRTLWRTEIIDQVFIVMSFAEKYKQRYENIIKPAIEDVPINGINLKAYRVDNSKTGDSILTDIANVIAHSRLVLADISVIHSDKELKTKFRNGNVMYEVGIALACRQTSDVLLIRDDSNNELIFHRKYRHAVKLLCVTPSASQIDMDSGTNNLLI